MSNKSLGVALPSSLQWAGEMDFKLLIDFRGQIWRIDNTFKVGSFSSLVMEERWKNFDGESQSSFDNQIWHYARLSSFSFFFLLFFVLKEMNQRLLIDTRSFFIMEVRR